MLGGGEFAGHLVTASLLSAPAAILLAKVMVPETETPETLTGAGQETRTTVNLIDAASEGALAALRLAAYIGALLVAFVALIAMLDDAVGWLGSLVGVADLTLPGLFGLLLRPAGLADGHPLGGGAPGRRPAGTEDRAQRVPRLRRARRAGLGGRAVPALGGDRLLRPLRLRELRLPGDPDRRHGRDRALPGVRTWRASGCARSPPEPWPRS